MPNLSLYFRILCTGTQKVRPPSSMPVLRRPGQEGTIWHEARETTGRPRVDQARGRPSWPARHETPGASGRRQRERLPGSHALQGSPPRAWQSACPIPKSPGTEGNESRGGGHASWPTPARQAKSATARCVTQPPNAASDRRGNASREDRASGKAQRDHPWRWAYSCCSHKEHTAGRCRP